MNQAQLGEEALVAAAQQGDEGAFETLVRSRRGELHRHCYRLLASPDDADDAVQEAIVRAWRSLEGFEHRSSFRTWLFRITTNVALDIAKARSRRELPVGFSPPSDGELADAADLPWIGPIPVAPSMSSPEGAVEARESIELAYVAALQHLPARQRAAFILRDVLAFTAEETASILETTTASVTSALQRARSALRVPTVSQQTELASLGDVAVRALAARYASAIESADIAALLALLTEDVSWSMPPVPSWYRGSDDVRRFLTRFVFPERWAHVTTWANGQLAVAGYLMGSHGAFVPAALDVLELRAGSIASVTGFLTGEALPAHQQVLGLFDRFDLPATLTGS